MTKHDVEQALLIATIIGAILLSGLFLGILLIHAQDESISHPLHGAGYDWYPQDQTDPQDVP